MIDGIDYWEKLNSLKTLKIILQQGFYAWITIVYHSHFFDMETIEKCPPWHTEQLWSCDCWLTRPLMRIAWLRLGLSGCEYAISNIPHKGRFLRWGVNRRTVPNSYSTYRAYRIKSVFLTLVRIWVMGYCTAIGKDSRYVTYVQNKPVEYTKSKSVFQFHACFMVSYHQLLIKHLINKKLDSYHYIEHGIWWVRNIIGFRDDRKWIWKIELNVDRTKM